MSTKTNNRIKEVEASKNETLTITAPNFITAKFAIRSTAPYVQHKFSAETKAGMLEGQMKTKGTSKKGQQAPRNPKKDWEGAFHRGPKGQQGMPAAGFRSALISACRVAGFTMTKAKLSIFVIADFYDVTDGTPLVAFSGDVQPFDVANGDAVRLESGVASIAFRPKWFDWSAMLTLRWDGDQFSHTDVANLLMRAGMQVGIGEGRPDSKKSHGMGWGTFELVGG